MSDPFDPKSPADDVAGRPDSPQLADVVEFSRDDAASTPAQEPPKAPVSVQETPAKPAAPKPEPPKPEPPKPEPPKASQPQPAAAPTPTPIPAPIQAPPAPVAERRVSPWREPTGSQFQLLAYLRANGRRVLWMVVVPILAAEVVLGLFALGPQQYKATATVNVPAKGNSVSDVTQSTSDYRSLLKSDAVARQVTAQTQVNSGTVKSGVSSKRRGTSGLVDVTYTNSRRTSVTPVLRAVTRAALTALIQPEVDVAERALQKGQDDLAAVQQEIIQFNASHGLLLNPPEAYRAKVAELGRLRVQAQQARQQNNSARAASLDASVAQAQKEVDSLAAIVRDYQKLQTKHDQLQSTVNASSNKLTDAQARIDAANASSTIDVGGVSKVNALAKLARAAAITFVVGLLLMVGLLVMLEVLGYGAGSQGILASTEPAPRPARQPVTSTRRSSSSKKRRR